MRNRIKIHKNYTEKDRTTLLGHTTKIKIKIEGERKIIDYTRIKRDKIKQKRIALKKMQNQK